MAGTLDRRGFLIGGGACLVASALHAETAETPPAPLAPLTLQRHTIAVSASKSFSALHVSDTHLAFCDGRDMPRKMHLAAQHLGEIGRG